MEQDPLADIDLVGKVLVDAVARTAEWQALAAYFRAVEAGATQDVREDYRHQIGAYLLGILNDALQLRCECCAQYFVPHDNRQRYCSNACATRARVRRFRARQRGA